MHDAGDLGANDHPAGDEFGTRDLGPDESGGAGHPKSPVGQCPTGLLEGNQGFDPPKVPNGPEIENPDDGDVGHQDDDEDGGAGHVEDESGPRLRSKGKARDGYKRFAYYVGRDLQANMGYLSEGDLTKDQYERHKNNVQQQAAWKAAANNRRGNVGG